MIGPTLYDYRQDHSNLTNICGLPTLCPVLSGVHRTQVNKTAFPQLMGSQLIREDQQETALIQMIGAIPGVEAKYYVKVF